MTVQNIPSYDFFKEESTYSYYVHSNLGIEISVVILFVTVQ